MRNEGYMKNILLLCLCMVGIGWTACANNPLRTSPYPLEANDVFINPAPLLVPPSMREGDLLQFNLSKDRRFRGNDDILSEPVPWGVFNPHRVLDEGKWYWRFRSVDKDGTEHPWSKTYSFTIKPGTPQFATPQLSDFLAGIPEEGPRIYCFLREGLEEARRTVRSHPEFSNMIEDGRRALAMSFTTDTVPYKHVFEMSESFDMLNTAYQMLGRKIYADKMVQNLRCLLPENPTDEFLANDFNAGELVYVLACTYETCGDLLAPAERRRTEELILEVISRYYHERLVGQTENRFFDEHIWQFTVRRFVQGCLVTYGKYPEAKEYLQYFYELWTSRALATGFNRDGAWQNGANYFSANAVSLMYLPKLFGYATGTDFLQHPWYRNAGKGVACTWLPGSLSSGFGDGHEKMNEKPLRIRSAFADFLARELGDPYAAWYSDKSPLYRNEFETRLYRMACGKKRPSSCTLPQDAPKAVWFKDCGEMVANSDWDNPEKNVSLSFHSSPFGSGNHTHSNQNAFNLHYGGEAVFHAAGHYMNFSDPHNLLSYRNTRAHNTVLVDGIGQPFTPDAYGYIVRMYNGDHLSYALGDASEAYCGVSDIRLWREAFEKYRLEQSPENGFGKNPLTKYRRHIFLLYPNIVVIYDELEASEAARWDWLLHSPVKFEIDEASAAFSTDARSGKFRSFTRLFSGADVHFAQTDRYAAPPNEYAGQRGEDFTPSWTLTASLTPVRKARVLAVIQIEADGMKAVDVKRVGNRFKFGSWTLEAELDGNRRPALYIENKDKRVTFFYGKRTVVLDGIVRRFQSDDASVLSDTENGCRKIYEMMDCKVERMGEWK